MSSNQISAEIGIIGGTGSDVELEDAKDYKIYTPYGDTSDLITIGNFGEKKVAFLPRHGKGHRIPPHMLNFRANIWAMKSLGVSRIFSPSAVGSLQEEWDKGDFLVIDQYIDRTKGREDTFYSGGNVCHISQADPFCPELSEIFYKTGKDLGIKINNGGTYVCINGPRFSTRAESNVFRQWGGDVIGMTCYPEVVLAAEQEICYTTIAMITDMDVWAAECGECGVVPYDHKCGAGEANPMAVSIEEIVETMTQNAKNLKKLLNKAIPQIPTERSCNCGNSLQGAII